MLVDGTKLLRQQASVGDYKVTSRRVSKEGEKRMSRDKQKEGDRRIASYNVPVAVYTMVCSRCELVQGTPGRGQSNT